MTPELPLDILDARPVVVRAHRAVEVVLVGCGGTGSWLAPHLARLAVVLGEAGTRVALSFVDPDRVEAKNCARQHFCPAEIGAYKAVTLARRYGLALGLDIAAVPVRLDPKTLWGLADPAHTVRVLVGAVDNAAARQSLAAVLDTADRAATVREAPPSTWWLDCGNHAQAGQVLLGCTSALPRLHSAFTPPTLCRLLPSPALQAPELLVAGPEERAPARLSCAELALANAQSLSINQAVAAVAFDYLLRLLITGDGVKFATYFDLPAGTMTSRYTTPAAVARAVGQAATFFDPLLVVAKKKQRQAAA